MQTKFSICNEGFGKEQSLADWRELCAFLAECGYDAVEIAPFTFAPAVTEISAETRRELRSIAADNGLAICGLHFLMLVPPGLHINAVDMKVRERTVDYLRELIRFSADVGAPVMTFGSPGARRVEDCYDAAWERTVGSFQAVLPALEEQGIILCQESLPAAETDFITTVAEAQRMVDAVGHPNFGLMLDVKSLAFDEAPITNLIRRYGPKTHHFHANDANKRAPGYGEVDFCPIGVALSECGYEGYVSLEPFDYYPDPKTMARESLKYLQDAFSG